MNYKCPLVDYKISAYAHGLFVCLSQKDLDMVQSILNRIIFVFDYHAFYVWLLYYYAYGNTLDQ